MSEKRLVSEALFGRAGPNDHRHSVRSATLYGAALASAAGALLALRPFQGAVILTAVVCSIVLFFLPTRVLPALALAAFVLIPVAYIDGIPLVSGRYFTPSTVILSIWLIRIVASDFKHAQRPIRGENGLRISMYAAVVTISVLSLLGADPVRSLMWTASAIVCLILPASASSSRAFDERMRAVLLRTWMSLGILLSVVAGLESILASNPLTRIYSFEQHWSVYRVTTTLGHPLMNSTFFAMTACIGLLAFLLKGGKTAGAAFVAAGFATALTASRSGIVALLCGLLIVIAILVFSSRTKLVLKISGMSAAVLSAVGILNIPLLKERMNSSEAEGSAGYRETLWESTLHLLEGKIALGNGPGTSGQLAVEEGMALPLESAILGSLVSLGVVGALVLVIFLSFWIVNSARAGRYSPLCAGIPFLVSGVAYPLWEAVPSSLILFGLLALLPFNLSLQTNDISCTEKELF